MSDSTSNKKMTFGAGTTPIVPLADSEGVGSNGTPVYLSGKKLTAFSGNLGENGKPLKISGGALTPVDSELAPVASPTFTGTPTAPTATDVSSVTGDAGKQISTLGFVITRIANWWTDICSKAISFSSTLSVTGAITSSGALEGTDATLTNVKSKAALCTDANGKIAGKTVDTTVTENSTNLVTSGAVYQFGSSTTPSHSHGTIDNAGTVTMKASPADTDPATVKYVADKISSWWSNLCANTAITVQKLWTFTAGIVVTTSGSAHITTKNTSLVKGTKPSADTYVGLISYQDKNGADIIRDYNYVSSGGIVSFIKRIYYFVAGGTKYVDAVNHQLTTTSDGVGTLTTTLPGLLLANGGVRLPSTLKSKDALCTDSNGTITSKTVSTSLPSATTSTNLITDGAVRAAIYETAFDMIYPVGSIYITVATTAYSKQPFSRGTWTKVADGQSLWTGTSAQLNTTLDSLLPQHTHTLSHTHTMAHTHTVSGVAGSAASGSTLAAASIGTVGSGVTTSASSAANTGGASTTTTSTGTIGTAVTDGTTIGTQLRPKSLAVVMWKRTA